MGTGNMEFDNVQLDVEFSQASERDNITSNENIALSFGKLSTWFEALVPEGGSSGQILGWKSSGTAKWINSPTIPTVNDGIFSIKKGSESIVTFSANQSSNTDLLFVEGSNVTITPNSTNRTVTIASVDEKVKVDKFVSTTQTDYLLTGAVASMATTAAHLVVDNADGVASARMRLQKGTTDTIGQSMLMLGNNIQSGTAKNMQGMIQMYSSSDKYGKIVSESLTDNRTWALPDKTGTIAMISDIIPVNNGKLTIKGGTTSVAEFTANQSGNTDFSIVAGSNVTVTPDATNSKITIASSDTKVTSVGNHYTPSRDTSADKTASASGATAAWSIDVVKGVTLQTDGKGHVTGLSVTSGKIPANPVPSNAVFTDANVTQTPVGSTYTNFRPLLIGASSGTSAGFTPTLTTAGVYATAGIYCQPSSGYVYASDFMTNTYPSGTGSSLSQYGLYLKSYFKCADSSQTVLQYAGYGVRTYSGKITSSDGIAVAVGCGGLTVLGSGESAHNLISLISDDQKISGNTTLNVGGTLNTTFAGNTEVAIVSSDDSIYLITNCQTIANRKPVCLDTNSYFYPGTNKTGSIGTSSYMWNSVYAATIYENGTSLASKYAAIGHTHGLLHSDLTQTASNGTTGGWSVIGIDPAVNGYVLKSIRISETSPNWLSGGYGAGIAFGGYDTKGVISMNYHLPTITFAGGNHNSSKTEPVWYFKISGTSGNTYNLANFYDTASSRPANTVLAAPNGSNGSASFRKLVAADLPSHTHNYAGSSSAGGPATYVGLPRVTADSKSFPGQNKVEFKEYSNTSTNTPSSAWYHIISMQGGDTKYGTQLALGMTANAVYYRNYTNGSTWINWQPLGRFIATPTSGQVVITDGTTGGIKSSGSTISPNPSSVETTNWNTTSERTIVVTKGWMSWWNGAYNGTSSNLAYCKKGEFGTIVTKNTGDYVLSYGNLNGTIGLNSPAADVKTFFMTSSVPTGTSSIGYNTAGNEYTLIFGKGVNTAGYGAVLKFGYDSLYPLMLRVQNGIWKSTDWEKISAGYADIAENVSGTVAIAHGGTGSTTRLGALKNLTIDNVGTSATYFLTITDSWGKGGYTSVAQAKTVLGMGTLASRSYVEITSITTVTSGKKYTCTANTQTYKTFMVEFSYGSTSMVQWFTVTGTTAAYYPIFASMSTDAEAVLSVQCGVSTSATITFTFSNGASSPVVEKVVGFNFGG